MPQRVHILVLDDDREEWDFIKEAAEELGINNMFFYDNHLALLAALDREPAVVLLDYQLKGITGKEVMEKVKELCTHCFFIITTGHPDLAVVIDLLNAHADHFLTKEPNRNYYDKLMTAIIEGRRVVSERIELAEEKRRATENMIKTAEYIQKRFIDLENRDDDRSGNSGHY